MKFAVFALISMYIIVQTCGTIIMNHPESSKYYKSVLSGRKLLLPQSSTLSSTHYYKNAYKPIPNYMHTVVTTNGRRMIVPLPVPIVHVPVGSSSSAASHRNQHTFNYQQAILSARRNQDVVEEPIEEVDDEETVPTCETKITNVSAEEPEVELESNDEKYRQEICLYIAPKVRSLLKDMSPEEAANFVNDFVLPVDNYCDFANLE